MSLSVKAGSFDTPTVTGNQAITGVGFQPKFVLFIFGRAQDADAATLIMGLGAAVSSTARGAVVTRDDDNRATASVGTLVRRGLETDQCLIEVTGTTPTTVKRADFVSFDADGFTINWQTIDANDREIHYLCLGGTDLTNAHVGAFNLNTSTGNQAVTGAGFQPDLVLFLASIFSTTDGPVAGGALMLGAAKSATERWATTIAASDNVNPSSCASGQRTDACINRISAAAAELVVADFVSMDADGFTINLGTASATSSKVIYIALKGGQYKLGSFDQPASTGNQATTGVGFQPSALVFASDSKANHASPSAHSRLSAGFAVSSSEREVCSSTATDNVTTTETAGGDLSTRCIRHISGNTPTVDSDADFVSHDSDGFTVNWTTADATARRNLYLAIGAAGGATPETFGFYRRRVG